MIRIAITAEAFEAIKPTMPLGRVGYENECTASGGYLLWLDQRTVDKLKAAVVTQKNPSPQLCVEGGLPLPFALIHLRPGYASVSERGGAEGIRTSDLRSAFTRALHSAATSKG